MEDDHAIFVGGKPFMNYVTAVVMQFTTKGADTVVIRSRGKFISRAVDVAEVVKSRFLKDQVEVGDITMGSEEFQNREGKTVRVSTLDIALNKLAVEVRPIKTAKVTKTVPKEEPKAEETPAEETKEEKTPEEPAAETPAEESK